MPNSTIRVTKVAAEASVRQLAAIRVTKVAAEVTIAPAAAASSRKSDMLLIF